MNKQKVEDAMKVILEEIGEDINREGITYTPQRVARLYNNMFYGYRKKLVVMNEKERNTKVDDDVIPITIFENSGHSKEMLIREVNFISTCEHHVVPIEGKCWVGIIPDNKLLGMIILIRNKISTFDSSTILQGTRVNEFINPIDLNSSLQIPSADFIYTKQFCTCPVCSNVNYNDHAKNNPSMIGRNFIGHNLWHMLKMNVFLDAIPLNRYTETVNKVYPLSDDLKRCLDFCDECDKNGFKITYGKYKHYLEKKDVTKQKSLDI